MRLYDIKPAFPVPADINPDGYQGGMDMREHFASMAMQGILASGATICPDWGSSLTDRRKAIAIESVKMADILICELEKGDL